MLLRITRRTSLRSNARNVAIDWGIAVVNVTVGLIGLRRVGPHREKSQLIHTTRLADEAVFFA